MKFICSATTTEIGDHRKKEIDGLVVCRVKPTFRSPTFNRVLKFPLFANPFWFFQILSLVYRFRIEAIQVIDLPLAAAAWAIARAFRIPVIMDMWENYPEALKGWAKLDWKTRWFKESIGGARIGGLAHATHGPHIRGCR